MYICVLDAPYEKRRSSRREKRFETQMPEICLVVNQSQMGVVGEPSNMFNNLQHMAVFSGCAKTDERRHLITFVRNENVLCTRKKKSLADKHVIKMI